MKTDVFMTKAELAARWDVTTKTIESWVKDGLCPKPHRFGKRRVRWKLMEIELHETTLK